MDHVKSSFYFKSTDNNWRVDYLTKSENSQWPTYIVYLNDEIYHDFGGSQPRTNGTHATKSQAKEIISAARKINKERDKRDKKINKILG
jgi:hypothetical protein